MAGGEDEVRSLDARPFAPMPPRPHARTSARPSARTPTRPARTHTCPHARTHACTPARTHARTPACTQRLTPQTHTSTHTHIAHTSTNGHTPQNRAADPFATRFRQQCVQALHHGACAEHTPHNGLVGLFADCMRGRIRSELVSGPLCSSMTCVYVLLRRVATEMGERSESFGKC